MDNLYKKFDVFPWADKSDDLKKWQTGNTGYPIVDAAMR
jgi:deoxyribodipyrimidine photo-lyase